MTEPRERTAWSVAVVATLGMSVSYVDRQTLAAIAPSVTKALAIDNAHYGWLLSAFSMAYLACAPLAGGLVDRVGARRGFAAAIIAWSIVAGAHAFVASFVTLFVLRVLLGTTESPSFPAAAQAIRRALPGARRPLAVGLLFTGSSVGAVLAAKLAIPLDQRFGFRWAFVGTALLGTAWLPFWLLATRGHGLDRPPAPVKQESAPAPAPLSWSAVVFSPPVLRTVVAVAGTAPALMFVLNWTSKYLVDGWGMDKGAVGNLVIVPPLAFDVGAVGFGALASGAATQRLRGNLLVVSVLFAAALVLAPFATSPHGAIAACSAAALGGGGIYALVTTDMLARVPMERAASASGVTAGAQSLAHVVGGPLVGWSIDRTHGYTAALLGLGVVVVPAMVAFIFWPGIDDRSLTAPP